MDVVPGIGNAEAVINKVWKPTDKQNQILCLPDTIFEALGGGAAGGGKTDLGLMIPPARQFTEHPKFKGLVMRRTMTDLEKEIIPRQQEWYAPMGGTYNETKKRWKFASGAMIQNGHAEREQDVRKYDSAEYNYIDWDESTHFTGFQYLYLSISRCRSSSPDLPAFVRSFTNPGNIGHSFFKNRFVDPCPFGRKILVDRVTKERRIYIPFLGKDNPHLLLNDPGYLTRLEGLPEIEKKAKLYGDWNSYEGQVFSEFRVLHLADEPEYAVHVIDNKSGKFVIPNWWPRILCIDWGWDAMTFAIWAAISPEGRVYIYRTWAWFKTYTPIWAAEIVKLTGDEVIEDLCLCHSAGQHRGEELTIQEQVSNAFDNKYVVNLAKKDRIGGKTLVHEYLRWKQIPRLHRKLLYDGALAGWILRNKGEQSYNEYLAMFVDTPDEDNIPKLQILSHGPEGRENKELIDVIPSCMPSEINPEDVAEFFGDDPYDTLRMVVKSAHRYIDQANVAFQRLAKLEALNAKNTPESQTAFYMELARTATQDQELYEVRGHRRIGNRRFH